MRFLGWVLLFFCMLVVEKGSLCAQTATRSAGQDSLTLDECRQQLMMAESQRYTCERALSQYRNALPPSPRDMCRPLADSLKKLEAEHIALQDTLSRMRNMHPRDFRRMRKRHQTE